MQYLAVCDRCSKTYYVDSVSEVNQCSCGGKVVVGYPAITREEYDKAGNLLKARMIQTTIDSQKAVLERKEREELLESQKRLAQEQAKAKSLIVQTGCDVYDYEVEIITDASNGAVSRGTIKELLDRRSAEGYRLVMSYCNEVGRDSNNEYGFFGTYRVNATICQHVFIFEKKHLT